MVNPEVGATPWMVLPVVGAEDSSVSSSTGEEGAVEGVAERGLEGRPSSRGKTRAAITNNGTQSPARTRNGVCQPNF